MPENQAAICSGCSAELDVRGSIVYIVGLVSIAHPLSGIEIGDESLEEIRLQMDELLRQMQQASETDAMESVHRQAIHFLCEGCWKRWKEDPFAGLH